MIYNNAQRATIPTGTKKMFRLSDKIKDAFEDIGLFYEIRLRTAVEIGVGFMLAVGLIAVVPQKVWEHIFPNNKSQTMKELASTVNAIQEEQKKTTEELKKIISRENARREVAALRQEIGKTNSNMMVQEELVKENEALRQENARLKNAQGTHNEKKPPLALLKEGKTVTVPFKETIVPLKLKSKPPSAQHAQPSHPTL